MKARISVIVPDNFGQTNLDRLIRRLSEQTGESLQRIAVVRDNSLIGGFIIRQRNRIYDASLKTRLEQVRERLGAGE